MDKQNVPLLATRKGVEKHTFYFRFEQLIDAHVTKAGNMVEEFHNFMEETVETTEAVTNENLAATAYRLFRNFLRSQQLQREKGFKTSQPIIVTYGIDGKIETRKTKFSINPKRMESRMNEMAELTVMMFNKAEAIHKTTFKSVLEFQPAQVRLLVDKIVKKEKAPKADAPAILVENVG